MSDTSDLERMRSARRALSDTIRQQSTVMELRASIVDERDATQQPNLTTSTYGIVLHTDPIAEQNIDQAKRDIEDVLMGIPAIEQ